MLNQLVESRENFEGAARRGGFLLTTMVLIVSLFASGILWSLFAKDFGVGDESLAFSMLVAPVPVPADESPAPEPVSREVKPAQSSKERSELPSRRENILRISESPLVPMNVSTAPSKSRERPAGLVRIFEGAETDGSNANPRGRGADGGGISEQGITGGQSIKPQIASEIDTETPPVLKPAPPVQKLKPATQSLGVVNGRAVSLPKPVYPAAAQSLHISGEVSVQVAIDEAGRVTSARAVGGHTLLRAVSEAAARNAVFKPTLLSNQPVKVTGVIVYKFTAQ